MTGNKVLKSDSIDKNIPNKLLSVLYSQRLNNEMCDVELIVNNTIYYVHACVIAAYSLYLRNLILQPSKAALSELTSEDGDNEVSSNNNMDNSSLNHKYWSFRKPLQLSICTTDSGDGVQENMQCSTCLGQVLDFIYLGKIQIQKEHIDHVQLLGDVLQISELLVICEKYMKKCGLKNVNSGKNPADCLIRQNKLCIVVGHQKGHTSHVGFNIKNKINNHSQPERGDSLGQHNDTSLNAKELYTPGFKKDDGYEEGNALNFEQNSKKNASTNSSTNYPCCKCAVKFANSTLLQQHYRQTHLGRLYTCYSCKYSSQKAFELLKHLLKSNHRETFCSLCMFEAENLEKLKKHLEQHNHPKPFFCSTCNLRFQTRTGLKLHTPKHSTGTPYSCSVCSRGFKWKQGLQNHMVVHTTEKKHLCAQCGFSTAHKSTFNAHELLHQGSTFKCSQPGCLFQTMLKRNLVSHLATHNKEKLYQCEICGQAFSQSKNMRRHALKHSSAVFIERCSLCLFQTTRIDKLVDHFKKQHPEGDLQLLKFERKKRMKEYIRKEKKSDISSTIQKCALKEKRPSSVDVNTNVDNEMFESVPVETNVAMDSETLTSGMNNVLLMDYDSQMEVYNSEDSSTITLHKLDVNQLSSLELSNKDTNAIILVDNLNSIPILSANNIDPLLIPVPSLHNGNPQFVVRNDEAGIGVDQFNLEQNITGILTPISFLNMDSNPMRNVSSEISLANHSLSINEVDAKLFGNQGSSEIITDTFPIKSNLTCDETAPLLLNIASVQHLFQSETTNFLNDDISTGNCQKVDLTNMLGRINDGNSGTLSHQEVVKLRNIDVKSESLSLPDYVDNSSLLLNIDNEGQCLTNSIEKSLGSIQDCVQQNVVQTSYAKCDALLTTHQELSMRGDKDGNISSVDELNHSQGLLYHSFENFLDFDLLASDMNVE